MVHPHGPLCSCLFYWEVLKAYSLCSQVGLQLINHKSNPLNAEIADVHPAKGAALPFENGGGRVREFFPVSPSKS